MKDSIITNIVSGTITDVQTTDTQTTITIPHTYQGLWRPLPTKLRFSFAGSPAACKVGHRVSVLFDLIRFGRFYELVPRNLVLLADDPERPSVAYHRLIGTVLDVSDGYHNYEPFTRILMKNRGYRLYFPFWTSEGEQVPAQQGEQVSLPFGLIDQGKGYSINLRVRTSKN